MRLIDISPAIDAGTPAWPGDQTFESVARWSIEKQSSVNVSTVTTTTHIGAHIDAPLHVRSGAADVSQTPLEACVGQCLVVDTSAIAAHTTSGTSFVPVDALRARIEDLVGGTESGITEGLDISDALVQQSRQQSDPVVIERILLRHRTSAFTSWDPGTPGIDPEFVKWFGEQGGRLIGLDLASFDPEQSQELLAHHAAVDAGIVMLEGLDLLNATEGFAELIALPVPWRGTDAAPVRAVLRL